MKKVVLSLAVAGGLVSGDCFAMNFSQPFANGNNSENNLQKVESTKAENNSNRSKLKRIAIKMRTAAVTSTVVTTSFFMQKNNTSNFWKRCFSYGQAPFIFLGINAFQNDIKQRNPDFFAKFIGAVVGSEFISFLFNRNTYHAGLGMSTLLKTTLQSWYDSIAKTPMPLKIFPIYVLIVRGAELCAGKDISKLDPPQWLLNKEKVNRLIKAPACKLARGLEKINSRKISSKKVASFFDEHKSSLGDFLRKKIETWKMRNKIFSRVDLLNGVYDQADNIIAYAIDKNLPFVETGQKKIESLRSQQRQILNEVININEQLKKIEGNWQPKDLPYLNKEIDEVIKKANEQIQSLSRECWSLYNEINLSTAKDRSS